jgi:hypothetical protein
MPEFERGRFKLPHSLFPYSMAQENKKRSETGAGIFRCTLYYDHSLLKASIGSMFDAFQAGYRPDRIQTVIPVTIPAGM